MSHRRCCCDEPPPSDCYRRATCCDQIQGGCQGNDPLPCGVDDLYLRCEDIPVGPGQFWHFRWPGPDGWCYFIAPDEPEVDTLPPEGTAANPVDIIANPEGCSAPGCCEPPEFDFWIKATICAAADCGCAYNPSTEPPPMCVFIRASSVPGYTGNCTFNGAVWDCFGPDIVYRLGFTFGGCCLWIALNEVFNIPFGEDVCTFANPFPPCPTGVPCFGVDLPNIVSATRICSPNNYTPCDWNMGYPPDGPCEDADPDGGCCDGGGPPEAMPKLRGLGDLIAKGTKAIGLKPCAGCKKRQEWINAAVPFRSRP